MLACVYCPVYRMIQMLAKSTERIKSNWDYHVHSHIRAQTSESGPSLFPRTILANYVSRILIP